MRNEFKYEKSHLLYKIRLIAINEILWERIWTVISRMYMCVNWRWLFIFHSPYPISSHSCNGSQNGLFMVSVGVLELRREDGMCHISDSRRLSFLLIMAYISNEWFRFEKRQLLNGYIVNLQYINMFIHSQWTTRSVIYINL